MSSPDSTNARFIKEIRGILVMVEAVCIAVAIMLCCSTSIAADNPETAATSAAPRSSELAATPARQHYKFIEGKGYVICEEMLKRLNEISERKPQGPVCGYDILRSIPGVTLPGWKRIDLQEDKALYMRVALAWGVDYRDWKAAFSSPRPKPGTKFQFSTMPPDEDGEKGWLKRLRDPTFELYLLTNPWPRQEEGDVSLVAVYKTASEANRCKQVRSTLFSGDLQAPKSDWRRPDLRYPFRHGNRWYEIAEDFVGPATTGGVGIYWVQDHQRRGRATTLICSISRVFN